MRVPLLNFRGVPGPTFKLCGGSRVSDPRIPRSQVLGSWSHFYTMPAYNLCKLELGNYDKKEEDAIIRSKCEWYQHTWRKADKVLF